MTHIVTEALLHEIRRDSFSVGTHKSVDLLTGKIVCHVDATDARSGERWSVNALDEYAAAYELAPQIGWEFEE